MKQRLFILLLIFVHVNLHAQSVWIRYEDTTNQLMGYKDLDGKIMIPPKFEHLLSADSFHNIIAVSETINDKVEFYYLLKNGKKIGKDSVYMFDFMFDCESEGKILFRDKKKDRVGYFNKKGEVAIPAMYNYASPFHNGIAMVLRNAKRHCGEGKDTLNCEHLGWTGGESLLINEKNEVLLQNVEDFWKLDWYSMRIDDHNVDTSVYINYQGTNQTRYSFINKEMQFRKWFTSSFIPAVSSRNNSLIKEMLFPKITVWKEQQGWTAVNKPEFIDSFSTWIRPARFQVTNVKTMDINEDDLTMLGDDRTLFNEFFDACGQHNRHKFPVFQVFLNYYKKRTRPAKNMKSALDREYEVDYQEEFHFIRTLQGYRLISVSAKN